MYSQCVGGDFEAITVVSGEGFIIDEVDKIKLNKEDTMYLFKNAKYKISGNLEIIRVYSF